MIKIINTFLLVVDKFILKCNLRQHGFTYRSCRPLLITKKESKIFKETGDSKYIYQNELDKACSQHDMAYEDFKDLPRRTPADK